jgi:hypothetical protein
MKDELSVEERDHLRRRLAARVADENAVLTALGAKLGAIEDAIGNYFVYWGAEHENEDCPQDDGCECPRLTALNEALSNLRAIVRSLRDDT